MSPPEWTVMTTYLICADKNYSDMSCKKKSGMIYNISIVVDDLVYIKSRCMWLHESTGMEIMCFDGKVWLAPALGDRG